MSLQTEFPERIVQLSTGQPGLRSTVTVEAREPASSDPTLQHSSTPAVLDFVSSDETLDRYSEIISVSGWRLDTYRRNPVFQNSHQYGDIIFTLGRALTTEVRDSKLVQRIQFATDANPFARIAYALYKGKFLNAVSVGFIPLRWEDGSSSSSCSSSSSEARRQVRRRYLEQELLEVSAVGIPANPNALALAYTSGAVQKSEVQATIDLLRQTISAPLAAVVLAKEEEPLLSFFRSLRDIMKHL